MTFIFVYVFIWPLLLPLLCLWAVLTAGPWRQFLRRTALASVIVALSAAPDAYIVAAKGGRSMLNAFPGAGLFAFAVAALILMAALGLRAGARAWIGDPSDDALPQGDDG